MKKVPQVSFYCLFHCLFALASNPAWSIEEPAFDLIATVDGIEYRHYPPYLVADTRISGDVGRNEAVNTGFRRLFKYISGDNLSREKIAMTAPVRQKPVRQKEDGTKISMTAPVRQSQADGGWSVAFVLPENFTLETVPRPTNPEIEIREIPGEHVAVLRYSGRWTVDNVALHIAELEARLTAGAVETSGELVVAYYNSPFSLPFMRRNEVMVPVAGVPAGPVNSN